MASYSKSILKNGDVRWNVKYYFDDPKTGMRKQIRKGGFRTQAEAKQFYTDVAYKQNNNLFAAPNRITLAEYLIDWHKSYVSKELKENTIASHGRYIEIHIIPKLGHIKLQELRPIHIRKFYQELAESGNTLTKGKGLSLTSIRQVRAILNKALRDAVRDELIARHPGVDVPLPKSSNAVEKKHKLKCYSEELLSELLIKMKGHPMELLILIALFTGLRRCEVLGITWDKVDLRTGTLAISSTININRSRKIYTDTPKTEKSNREVYLPEKIRVLLEQEYHKRYPSNVIHLNERNDDYVFCNEDGSPINPDTLSSRFTNMIRKFKMPHLTLHGLRHTYATIMLQKGLNPKEVSESLGHSKVSTTLDFYAHGSKEKRREMADMWNKII